MPHPIWLLLICLFLASCAAPGRSGFLNTNTPDDTGPMPQNYEQTIQAYLQSALKDPYSMRDFSAGIPVRASCAIGIYGSYHAWRVPAQYNAKNSYGAYVGIRAYYYWFHGERLKGITEHPSSCPEASGWGQ